MPEPAVCNDREPAVPAPRSDRVGVTVEEVDLLHRHTQYIFDDGRECRVVALAVHACAGVDVDVTAVGDFDLGVFDVQAERGGDLDVCAHADADLSCCRRRLVVPAAVTRRSL